MTGKSIVGDLTIITGGTVSTHELNIKLECATAELLSPTGFIAITKGNTIDLDDAASSTLFQRAASRSTPASTTPPPLSSTGPSLQMPNRSLCRTST